MKHFYILVLVFAFLSAGVATAADFSCTVPGCDVMGEHSHRVETAELVRDNPATASSVQLRRHPLGARKYVATREQALARARQLVDWLAGSNASPCHPDITREEYAVLLGFSSAAEAARVLKNPRPGVGWRFTRVRRNIPREDVVMSYCTDAGDIDWGSYRDIPVDTWCLLNGELETLAVDMNCLNVFKVARPEPMEVPVKIVKTGTFTVKSTKQVVTHYHFRTESARPAMHQCRLPTCERGYVPRSGAVFRTPPPRPRYAPPRSHRRYAPPPRRFPRERIQPPVAGVPGGYQYMDNRQFTDNRGRDARIQAGAGVPGQRHNHPQFPPERQQPTRPQPRPQVDPRHAVAAPGTGIRPPYTGSRRGQPGNLDYQPRGSGGFASPPPQGGGGPIHR